MAYQERLAIAEARRNLGKLPTHEDFARVEALRAKNECVELDAVRLKLKNLASTNVDESAQSAGGILEASGKQEDSITKGMAEEQKIPRTAVKSAGVDTQSTSGTVRKRKKKGDSTQKVTRKEADTTGEHLQESLDKKERIQDKLSKSMAEKSKKPSMIVKTAAVDAQSTGETVGNKKKKGVSTTTMSKSEMSVPQLQESLDKKGLYPNISNAMKEVWANRSEEERQAHRDKIREGMKRRRERSEQEMKSTGHRQQEDQKKIWADRTEAERKLQGEIMRKGRKKAAG